MNKKFLILIALTVIFTGISQIIATAEPDFSKPMREEFSTLSDHEKSESFRPPMNVHRPPSPEEFDRRLNLTEEQKSYAKAQRENSIQKIKPILDEINLKKSQINEVKKTDMPNEEIVKLEAEIKSLRRKAHEIRKENMKAFEATLNEMQLKELQKMKEEGRRNFKH